jgi:hypothetical protein
MLGNDTRSFPAAAALRALAVFALLLAVSAPAAATADPGPRQIGFSVSDYTDENGGSWIRLRAEFECVLRSPMDQVIATLWDFAASPKIFSRIDAIRVRYDTGSESETEQRTGVRILGLAFLSDLVLKNGLHRSGPASATVDFESIETDGSCLFSRGAWGLEERSSASGVETRVTYSLDTCVERRFPGQAGIMRAFGAGDMKKLMRELRAAVDSRAPNPHY